MVIEARPSRLAIWYRASRPFTLSAAVVPPLVGSALAFYNGSASLWLLLLMVAASLLVQIAANLVDEYSDHRRPEGREKLIAPYKVIFLGLLSAGSVKKGALVCLTLAALIGMYLILVAGWPVLVICLASLAAAYFYSAGSRPLGALGLGHPLVFVFMGPVMVMGSYFVQTGLFTLDSLWLSLAVGCTVTGILVANDLRDLEEDRIARKITPVTLFGRAFGRLEWTLLTAAAFLIVVFMVVFQSLHPLALLVLLSLPQAVVATRSVWGGQTRPALAGALKASARLHLLLGLLLAAGVALGRMVTL